MDSPVVLTAASAGVAVVLAAVVGWWLRTAARRDREVFRQMEPIMEDLWNPLRFLTDLRSVWPDLTESQRNEIESSSVYRDRFHETRAQAAVDQLAQLARRVRAVQHWRLRRVILRFLRDWETQEPDTLKVLLGMVRQQTQS